MKNGNEYWSARELQIVLDYKEWRKFEGVVQTAKRAEVKNFDKFHNSGYKGLYKEHYQQGQLLVCAPLLLNSTD